MDIVNLAIVLLEVIDMIAATGVGIPSCQRGASLREQQMRRGYNHKFYRGPAMNHILRGHGFLNITTGSYLTCAGMCLRDDACKSFNFCQDDKLCQLNSAVWLKSMSNLMFARGCLYYDEQSHGPEAEGALSTTPMLTTREVECSDPEPLGLEDRTIPDERMTASSVWSDMEWGAFPAKGGRLNNMDSYWSPSSSSGSWIQVDLGESKLVSGVITQGDPDGWDWRATKYNVAFKKDHSSTLKHVIDANGTIQVFDGNVHDATTPVTNVFDQSIKAVVVRVEPVAWNEGVAMRLELLGCYIKRME